MDEHEGIVGREPVVWRDDLIGFTPEQVFALIQENQRLRGQLAEVAPERAQQIPSIHGMSIAEFAARFLADLCLRYVDFYGDDFKRTLVLLLHDRFGLPSGPPPEGTQSPTEFC